MLLFHNRQPTITERSECEANAEDKGLKNEDFAASEMSSLCQGREREREREREGRAARYIEAHKAARAHVSF